MAGKLPGPAMGEQAEAASWRKGPLDRIPEDAEELVRQRKNPELDLPAEGTATLSVQRGEADGLRKTLPQPSAAGRQSSLHGGEKKKKYIYSYFFSVKHFFHTVPDFSLLTQGLITYISFTGGSLSGRKALSLPLAV